MGKRLSPIQKKCVLRDNKSWPQESEQADKWSFCLTAGKIAPRIRRDNEQTTTPEPHTGFQDPMGKWIATGTLAE